MPKSAAMTDTAAAKISRNMWSIVCATLSSSVVPRECAAADSSNCASKCAAGVAASVATSVAASVATSVAASVAAGVAMSFAK